MVVFGVKVWSFGVKVLSMQRIMIRSEGRWIYFWSYIEFPVLSVDISIFL